MTLALATVEPLPIFRSHDLAALTACLADAEMGLCTLVGIDGSFSRRLGAQIAIGRDGRTVGSLSDGCLERQLAAEMMQARAAAKPRLVQFGAGSPFIDFRLPCGSGLDILVDPAPNRREVSSASDGYRSDGKPASLFPCRRAACPRC